MGRLPNRYNPTTARKAVRNPRLVLGELNRLGVRANARYHAWRGRAGVDVMAADWDTLILLDACRYDYFAAEHDLPGQLERRRAPASDSQEFLDTAFDGRFHDTVYVTANPNAARLTSGTFHALVPLFLDEWDPDLDTVRPEIVAEAAQRAHERYPRKRLVVHFMQPHAPYLGPTGAEIQHNDMAGPDADVRSVWANLRYGLTDTTLADLRTAYRENLRIALDAVESVIDAVDGRTVITADHAELLGDRLSPIPVRGYGHPPETPVPQLRRVPWHVIDGPRREVCAEPPKSRLDIDQEAVDRRLRQLGYRE